MEKQYRDAFSSPLHTAVITYTYDSMNRLVSENCGDSRISYKYDLSGNRISRVTDGRTENYLYNSRNQLTQLTGDDKNISYTYDPAGNLTEEHSTEHKKIYFYDTYNRNTEITGNDFTQKNHYDAEGYRYSIEENDKVTDFVYRCGIMLAELDEAGNQAKTYTLGNEYAGHVSELNNSLTSENTAASYYITDEQGSIRYMLDQSGEVQNYYQYSAFGETIISEETTLNRLRYNAQTEDELTGLYYLRARYYAPSIGRFTQEDVIYNDGLNLYAYCNSNPVMYSDPSGFAKETCKSKVGGECDSESGSSSSKGSNYSDTHEILGPYYDEILEKHKTNPEFYAHPDDYKITEGIEYTNNRAEYTRMVKNGEIEPGHHKLGIADGGKNIQSNITYTGEKFLNRKLLPKDVLEYYDSVYGTKSNPHPKRIAIFEENGIVQFGKNPKHTEATTLQQKIHIWQKEKGIRK